MEQSKAIRMKILSCRYDVEEAFFSSFSDTDEEIEGEQSFDEEDNIELYTEGTMTVSDGRVTLSYEETELTGMEGSETVVSFSVSEPGLVSMYRSGSVSTTLVFERGKRHHCIYQTPIMPFEIGVRTYAVDNRILTEGTLFLDYVVEIRGAKAERTHFTLRIL